MSSHLLHAVAAAVSLALAGAASAVTVSASSSTPVDLGTFAAGVYQLTATGVVDLVGDGTFRILPDGVPETSVTTPNYAYFNPSGSFTADGNFGPAGANAKIGALAGTLSAAPTGPADFFLIGNSTQITLAASSHIYALVNDTFAANNTGAFDVTVSAVPEPSQLALLLAGVGIVFTVGRRRGRAD